MPELAYVNGSFGPIAEARVSIEDRGFQFGDGVYEVVAAYDGRPFQLEEHMRRLRGSARAIRIDYDFEAAPLEPVILEGLRRCGFADAMIYIQLTRGVAPRSHVIPAGITPTVVMTFKPLRSLPEELRIRGARVMTTLDIRWASCYVKATTLLPNVLSRNEAIRRGYDDAIFVTGQGEVRECTSANVFSVRDGAVRIPPRTESILHGVTQAFLLDCAAGIGIRTEEAVLTVDALRRSDEVFMSGTAVEVLGITSIDGEPVGGGHVGPVTQRLYNEFKKRTRVGATQGG